MRKRQYVRKEHKWIDAVLKKPISYSLVKMLFESGDEKIGWWNGSEWDNRLGVSEKVISWKKHNNKNLTRAG